MRVQDLIIFLFPLNNNDKEVIEGGRVLYNKHLQKIGKGKEELAESRRPVAPDLAQQAWLIQVHHKEKDFRGAIAQGNHYTVLESTIPFEPTRLSDDTGIYVVAHCSSNHMVVFGYNNFIESDGSAETEGAAAKLVDFFVKLKLQRIAKLCLVACNTVPGNGAQKDTLEELVIRLHDVGLHPLIAGWDVPIAVNVDRNSPNYGRKENTLKHTLLAEEKHHKFVYKFETVKESFEIDEAKAKGAGIESTYNRLTKGKQYKKEMLRETRPTFSPAPKEGKKGVLVVNWNLTFVRRMKYTAANWSEGKK